MKNYDVVDLRILATLQRDPCLSQREVAERLVCLETPYWRRMQTLQAAGVLATLQARVDIPALGSDLTVFRDPHAPLFLQLGGTASRGTFRA